MHLTRLFGREREVERVRQLIRCHRLVTIHGAGGSGKTRLAGEALTGLVDDYPDGIWFVELSAVGADDLVDREVAGVLDVPAQPGQPPRATVDGFLRDARCLLVLDNCEHLVGGCATFAEHVLRSSCQVRILATSREPLNIPAECAWRVPSLATPGRVPVTSAAEALQAPSVSLFLDRAQAADPDFQLTDANARDVAGICNRLDGIPLAIELAAARVPLFTPRQIGQRLDDCLPLLAAGGRTAVTRHQTIRAAIDWSYALLEPDERVMLAQLSVFVRGFQMDAAEAMWSAAGATTRTALELVGRLLNRSMLHSRPDRERYEMLEPMRQYARERLIETGALDDAHDRHLEYCSSLGREAEQHLGGADAAWWLGRLEDEHANIRAALEWGLTRDPSRALRLATAIGGFWYLHGHLAEGCSYLRRGLAHAADAASRLPALNLLGWLAMRAGDLEAAEAALQDCVDLEVSARIGTWAAEVRNNLGLLSCWMGDVEGARRHLDRSIELAGEMGDERTEAHALFNHSLVAFLTGCLEAAPERLRTCLETQERLGDRPGAALARGLTGCVAMERGDLDTATHNLCAALRSLRELGDTVNALFGLDAFTLLAVKSERYEVAVRLAAATAVLRKSIGAITFPLWQSRIDGVVDIARRILGPEASAEACAEGRRLTLAEAIDEALALREVDAGSGRHHEGTGPLSRREWETAVLVAEGLTNREIAPLLGIGQRTVDTHVMSCMNKLGLNKRTQIAAWVTRRRSGQPS